MAANRSMFWRLIFQALRLRLQRVFIIFSALTVGASIVTAMAAVYFDINTKMSQELRTFGANFYIGAANGGLMKERQLKQFCTMHRIISSPLPALICMALHEAI